MPKVIFIRHPESLANGGGLFEDFASIPLTEIRRISDALSVELERVPDCELRSHGNSLRM